MKRPLKILFASVGAAVAVYIAAASLLPFAVDVERLRPQAEAKLQAALGRRVSLGTVRLSLWGGPAVRAEGLSIGEPLAGPASGSLVAAAGRTTVRVAMLPLLRRNVQVRSIKTDDVRVSRDGKSLVSDFSVSSRLRVFPDGAVEAKGVAAGSLSAMPTAPRLHAEFAATLAHGTIDVASLNAEVGPLVVEAQGRVSDALAQTPRVALAGSARLARSSLAGRCEVLMTPSGPKASFTAASPLLDADEILALVAQWGGPAAASRHGFSFVPAARAGEGLPAVGEAAPARSIEVAGALQADRCTFRGLEMTDLSMHLSLVRGLAEIREFTIALYGGRAQGALTARPFDPLLPFSLEETAAGIAVGPLIAALAPAQAGTMEGTASLDLELSGSASGRSILPSLNGAGTLAIVDGKLATFGALKQVAAALELAGARGVAKDVTPFDHLSAHLDIVAGTAGTKDLEFRSRDIDGDGTGAVGPGGALAFDLLASFSKAVSDDLVARTPALSIRQDVGGRLSLPLKLRGTIREPRIQLDLDRVLHEGVLNRLK